MTSFIKDAYLQCTLTPVINKDLSCSFKLPENSNDRYLICENLEVIGNIKGKKIDELEERIKKLEEYIEELKYRPPTIGGEYYEEAKNNFNNLKYNII